MSSTNFKKAVWAHYRKHGRHALPWRKTRDPYRILVSEIMLQQTQVDRVVPKYTTFVKRFPTVRSLAQASLGDVLREWQGLGYNRRAKFLHEAAKAVMKEHGGNIPRVHGELVALPGIGPYTASAVRAFVWNEPDVFIETNIRSVFIRHFFPRSKKVSDSALLPHMRAAIDAKNPREWYWALMDYGAYLKKTHGNASRRSAQYVKQKPFKGSEREVRGAILRLLSSAPATIIALQKLPFVPGRIKAQIAALKKEGLVLVKGKKVSLP